MPEVAGLVHLVFDDYAGGLDAEAAAEAGVWGAKGADVDWSAQSAGEGLAFPLDGGRERLHGGRIGGGAGFSSCGVRARVIEYHAVD
ncbi:MAG: hypothetical protein JSV79_10440 [Armatimonadota bacterium]|nr:MAG: hypothetical protein JSV79_10440 [Armatimonadota bacterium]